MFGLFLGYPEGVPFIGEEKGGDTDILRGSFNMVLLGL